MQGLRGVGGFAQVLEPDAGLLFPLLDVGPAVGRKDEGDAVASPLADDVGLVFGADVGGVFLALLVEHGRNGLVCGLGLDDGNELHADEQGVVGKAV